MSCSNPRDKMRNASLGALFMAVLVPGAAVAAEGEMPADQDASVVKVFSTVRYPEPTKPWTRQSPIEVTGSGVIIDGNHILTNAHVVSYASQVQIQGSHEGDKVPATVEAIGVGIDLALLKLDDPAFFKTHAPLQLASALPEVKDNVLVYGFPTGGNALSITKGIISRIEYTGYTYPTSGLRIQIDAALNPGNSGGPALVGDKVIGIANSGLSNAQNIGYVIPAEEIALFLKDVADGHYDGKPAIYDDLQTLESPTLRHYLKLEDTMHGLVVRSPNSLIPGNPLKEWDLITRIGDSPIDDQGMVSVTGNLRVRFTYLVQKLAVNGKVPLTIVRHGATMPVLMPLASDRPLLIPPLYGDYPPYFIYGPVCFSKATENLVSSLTKNLQAMDVLTRAGSPLLTRRADVSTPEQEELVMICGPFFPHRIVSGYRPASGGIVESVNGTPVRSLKQLVSLLRAQTEENTVLRMAMRAETLVLPRQAMLDATEEILRDNGIRDQGSAELMAIWNKGK